MLTEKIKKIGALKKIVASLKIKNKKIVFTNGCFDLLHLGHVKYLEQAKKKGDILIVAVNSDSSVRKIKGKGRPLNNENDRVSLIAALESVDYAVIFSDETPIKIIQAIRPDILIKGADWKKDNIVGSKFVASYGGKALTIELIKGRSTTNLIRKIAKLRC